MSELRTATISDLAGTGPATLTAQAAAKTWFHLDMSGTPSIKDDLNVTSLTDHDTGKPSVSFTNNYASTNSMSEAYGGGNASAVSPYNASIVTDRSNSPGRAVSAVRMQIIYGDTTLTAFWDNVIVSGHIIGDLA